MIGGGGGLSVKLFNMLNGIWGPFTTDWFASEHNAKIGRYYSRFWDTCTLPGIMIQSVHVTNDKWGLMPSYPLN